MSSNIAKLIASNLRTAQKNLAQWDIAEPKKVLLKRRAQSILAKPEDTTIGEAGADLESLRAQAMALQTKINEINAQVMAYTEELAKSNQYGSMMEIQTEAQRLQGELTEKLKAFPANFIKFSDQVIYAKQQATRMNDAAWKQIIDQAKTRGKGVMRRVSLILDRVSLLFKKLTHDVTLKEFQPGELTPKKMQDIVKKNQEQVGKIDQYQQSQQDIAPGMQKYFLDQASGGLGTPGKKKGQLQQEPFQMEFDFLQDLINDLDDSLKDIESVNKQLGSVSPDSGSDENVVDNEYPLPKVAGKLPRFSSAKGGLQKVVRRFAKKN